MAQDLNTNAGASLRQLLDGFITLSDEYKHLAEQHRMLENNLSEASKELALLKDRFADEIPEELKQAIPLERGQTGPKPRRSLTDWLEDVRGSEKPEAQEAVTRIKEAELACFGIQNSLPECSAADDAIQSRRPLSVRGGSKSIRNRVRILATSDIEQDFTTRGTIGKLHCPFAPKAGINILGQKPKANQDHGFLTPRSSGSRTGLGGRRSVRASFNDPIRPDLSVPIVRSPAASEAGSHGPGCPIRFLGDHSPEEVAKYFEEHKHEIPRSHEVCVKRFQANAETARELDAKYGNVVNMIKGLGEKHQSMLPETPDPADESTFEEERRSIKKVKNWANAVSDAPDEDTKAKANELATRSEGANDEERVSHFDRPLKEIRVGESPSRPWGVPIPSKYLDRAASPDNASDTAASLSARADEDEDRWRPKPSVGVGLASQRALLPEKPKGNCPFDPAAFAAAAQPKPSVEAQDFAPEEHQIPKVTGSTTVHGANSEGLQSSPIINTGIVLVADSKYLGSRTFENQGTLVIGYGAEEARRMLWNSVKSK